MKALEPTKVLGLVLKATPIGENDKRVVLLTSKIGKITAFARGARRQNSQLLGATMPFAFGEYTIYEGRSSNTLVSGSVQNHFSKLYEDLNASYTGMYLLEFADYYTHEYNDEKQMLGLLYQSLRALESDAIPNALVRCVFEWRTFVINGEYPDISRLRLSESARYALQYITEVRIEKLYTFAVSGSVLAEMQQVTDALCRQYINKEFKTLEVLKGLELAD